MPPKVSDRLALLRPGGGGKLCPTSQFYDIDLHTTVGQLNRQLAYFWLKLGVNFFGFGTESFPLQNMDVVVLRLCDWKSHNQINDSFYAPKILSYFVANALWQKRINFVQKLDWFFFFSSNNSQNILVCQDSWNTWKLSYFFNFPRSMYLVQIWIFGAQTTFNLWTILYQIGHSDWMGLWMYFAAPDQFTTIIHTSEMWPFKFGFPNKNTHPMYVRHYKIIRTQIQYLWQKKRIWLLSWITTWK